MPTVLTWIVKSLAVTDQSSLKINLGPAVLINGMSNKGSNDSLFLMQKTVWFCIFHSAKGFLLNKTGSGIQSENSGLAFLEARRRWETAALSILQSLSSLTFSRIYFGILGFVEEKKKQNPKPYFLFCLLRKGWERKRKRGLCLLPSRTALPDSWRIAHVAPSVTFSGKLTVEIKGKAVLETQILVIYAHHRAKEGMD